MADATPETSGVVEVTLQHTPEGESVAVTSDAASEGADEAAEGRRHTAHVERIGEHTVITLDGERRSYVTHLVTDKLDTTTVWGASPSGMFAVKQARHISLRGDAAESAGGDITSPMPGAVIAVQVENGATVAPGDVIVIVEAMKMEHSLTAPIDGTVEILTPAGTQVAVDEVLARITPPETSA